MIVLAPLIGYLLGSFQTSYIIGKFYGIDIREHGSRNAGMTNVNRTLGKLPALIVFVCDVLKAVLAYVFVPIILFGASWSFGAWGHIFGEAATDTILVSGLMAGFGAIIGHNYPFYLKFKGGKGISCTIGVIIMTNLWATLICFVLGLVVVLVFRYISLASLAITFFWPIVLVVLGLGVWTVGISAAIGVMAWFKHRENILRLYGGTESKFSFGKSN